MKSNVVFVFLFILFFSNSSLAQESLYHVVIGAFQEEENARKFMEYAHKQNVAAIYAKHPEHDLFYVYVRITENKGDAYGTLKDMQNEGFRDAWIFKGIFAGSQADNIADNDTLIQSSETADSPHDQQITDSESVITENNKVPEVAEVVMNEPPAGKTEEPEPEKAKEPVAKPAGKPFIFKLINGSTGDPVTGLVRLQESDRAAQYRGYNGNETVYVVPPANRSGRWVVVCNVIGFKLYKKQVNYNNPQKDNAETGPQEEIIFPLKLVRVRRGDYIEMDEVKFFTNSSIPTPQSNRELTELVAMMEENPDYRIRIHGHTNGNGSREIISMGESQDFFSLNQANRRSEGSAKELSTLRAETIKQYLVSKGISESRMSTKGEGGKQPIFDPKGTIAAGNDRVEIEITKH